MNDGLQLMDIPNDQGLVRSEKTCDGIGRMTLAAFIDDQLFKLLDPSGKYITQRKKSAAHDGKELPQPSTGTEVVLK